MKMKYVRLAVSVMVRHRPKLRQLNYLQMKLKTFKMGVHLLLGGGGTSLTLWGAERKHQNIWKKWEPAASQLRYALAFLRGAK